MSDNKLEKTFEIFRFIRTVSTYAGLPTFDTMYIGRKSQVWVFLFKLYVPLTEILAVSLAVRLFVRFLIEPFSVTALVETASTVGYPLVECLRFLVLYNKKEKIANYFRRMENINYISTDKNDKFLKLFESKDLFKKKFGRYIFTFQLSMAFLVFLFGPFVFPPEYVKLPASYPFIDLHHSMKYLYYVLDFLTAVYVPLRITAVDLTCLTFITFHVTQQEYLKTELINILEEMRSGNEYEDKLDEWYSLHQKSLSLVKDLKDFLEPIILINYVYSLVCAVSAIFFIIEKSSMQLTQKLFVFGDIGAFISFLGWFCNYVDQINEQHESIPYQFSVDYVVQNKRLKNEFLILAPRCGRKIKISAMGFFNFSNKGFSEIISASVSLLATFWQIRKRALN